MDPVYLLLKLFEHLLCQGKYTILLTSLKVAELGKMENNLSVEPKSPNYYS